MAAMSLQMSLMFSPPSVYEAAANVGVFQCSALDTSCLPTTTPFSQPCIRILGANGILFPLKGSSLGQTLFPLKILILLGRKMLSHRIIEWLEGTLKTISIQPPILVSTFKT